MAMLKPPELAGRSPDLVLLIPFSSLLFSTYLPSSCAVNSDSVVHKGNCLALFIFVMDHGRAEHACSIVD